MIWTLAFWKGAAERAIKTFAATLAALLSASGIGLLEVDWGQALSVSGLATLVSFLIAVGNASFTAGGAPEVVAAPEAPLVEINTGTPATDGRGNTVS